MNLSRPFIERPVATLLLMIALLVSGILAWRLLPVAAFPRSTTRSSRFSPSIRGRART